MRETTYTHGTDIIAKMGSLELASSRPHSRRFMSDESENKVRSQMRLHFEIGPHFVRSVSCQRPHSGWYVRAHQMPFN